MPALKQTPANRLFERYGDHNGFLAALNPSVQAFAVKNIERSYIGSAPTLKEVSEAFGAKTATLWIKMQVENLNSFCGVTRKMDPFQMEELSTMIFAEYDYLKVSELLIFFHRFKAGRYCELFGSVDPQRVLISLRAFLKERGTEKNDIATRRKTERMMKEAEESRKNAVPYSEYLKTKAAKAIEQSKSKQENGRSKDEDLQRMQAGKAAE